MKIKYIHGRLKIIGKQDVGKKLKSEENWRKTMKTMKEKNMPNYQKNDKGNGFSVQVNYPTVEDAKVKHTVQVNTSVNFMGLGQFADWL